MKLNPPGSSSDLEVARAIARRLHHRARGTKPVPEPPATAPAPPAPATPPPPAVVSPPEPRALEPQPPALDAPELEPEPPVLPASEPAGVYGADTGEIQPEPPGLADVQENALEQLPPGGYGPAMGSFQAASNEQTAWSNEDTAGGDDALADLAAPPSTPGLEGLEPPESGVSPEDLLPEQPAPPDWSDPGALEADWGSEGEPAAKAEAPIEATSSWDDVADSCLALAPALGAMLVDPVGQVLTSRGDWPEPGPEAIAGRLVSMMERKLRDAPTRSVSAPLAGQHLTAWRVPAHEGYLTIVFMADAPLKADIRPAIDTAIQAAGG